MTELKLTINQCPVDDDRFILKIEIRGSTFEATDQELWTRAMLGKALRKAVQIWCDKMVSMGMASHSVEVDIDDDDDEGDGPTDAFHNQPNQRK